MKVFGSGWYAATGEPDTDRSGIVCFITVAGFLNGPGFEKMRDDLRRDCANIWVIDCSPEGHQPGIATRIFQGVQQPVCIVLAVRTPGRIERRRRESALLRSREAGVNKSSPLLTPLRSVAPNGSTAPPAGAIHFCPRNRLLG